MSATEGIVLVTIEANFGQQLRRARLAAGLTQEALAEHAGLGTRTIQGLERGESRPLGHTLERLSRALSLDAEQRDALAAAAPRPTRRRRRAAVQPLAAALVSVPAHGVRERAPLPAPWTSFVGRERELAQAQSLLRSTRLLTLTGPGGSGKTRLAVEVAARLAGDYDGGAAFVSLAPLSHGTPLLPAVARAVGVGGEADQPLDSLLTGALRDYRLLLVLDNCEHLPALAPLAADLLASCPQLTVLATSRAPLRLYGEQELPVPPLATPAAGPAAAEAPEQYAAVRLFVDRARAVRPDFALTPDGAAAVAALCRRLDGLPLAIELAAARMKSLSPRAVLQRLDPPLALLTGGPADAPVRQQTLRDAIAWSHDLLSPGEQRLFRRLAVFAGGCSVEAAEEICDPYGELGTSTLEALLSLAEKSLLQVVGSGDRDQNDPPSGDDSGGEPRFDMLATIRDFARERLDASGESTHVQARHAQHYAAAARDLWQERPATLPTTLPALSRPAEPPARLRRLRVERDNVRAALRWSLAKMDAAQSLRLGIAYGAYWSAPELKSSRHAAGDPAEGLAWLIRVLTTRGTHEHPALRRRVLHQAALVAGRRWWLDAAGLGPTPPEEPAVLPHPHNVPSAYEVLQVSPAIALAGHWDEARQLVEETLHMVQTEVNLRSPGNRSIAARAQTTLGWIHYNLGAIEPALALCLQAERVQREPGREAALQWTVQTMGQIALDRGEHAVAWRLFDEARTLNDTTGDRDAAGVPRYHLALLAIEQGDLQTARSLLRESLRLNAQIRVWGRVADSLEGFAALAAAERDPEHAFCMAGTAARLREMRGLSPTYSPARSARLRVHLARVSPLLSEEQRAQAWARGHMMSCEQAMTRELGRR